MLSLLLHAATLYSCVDLLSRFVLSWLVITFASFVRRLKLFISERWETAKNAAACHKMITSLVHQERSETLSSHKVNIITQNVSVGSVLL